METRRQGHWANQRSGPSSRPLIERLGPPKSTRSNHNGPRARGLTQQGDPSLPDADGYTLDEPMMQADSHGNERSTFSSSRNTSRTDVRTKTTNKGKSKALPPTQGSSRSVQTRLDDFRCIPHSQVRIIGPSRVNTLSQDINALIRSPHSDPNPKPNPNFFAAIAPPDIDLDDDDDIDPPDTSNPPASFDPQLSPVPSSPREFPGGLSPINDWDGPSHAHVLSSVEDADDSEANVSLSSHA
jgi:hypothetical protein